MFALGDLRKADLLGVLTTAKPDHDYTMRDTCFNIINEILDIEFPEGSGKPPTPAPPTSLIRRYELASELRHATKVERAARDLQRYLNASGGEMKTTDFWHYYDALNDALGEGE
jgi:hypothetical protein